MKFVRVFNETIINLDKLSYVILETLPLGKEEKYQLVFKFTDDQGLITNYKSYEEALSDLEKIYKLLGDIK